MIPLRPLGSLDWLSKQITVRILKIFLVEPLTNVCQGIIHLFDCNDKWKFYLCNLRKCLFPDVVSCENEKCGPDEKDNPITRSNSSFEDIVIADQYRSIMQGKIIELPFIFTFPFYIPLNQV